MTDKEILESWVLKWKCEGMPLEAIQVWTGDLLKQGFTQPEIDGILAAPCPTDCSVAVSNASFDTATCSLTIAGTGADNLEYSIDGISWFTDPVFQQCFDDGTALNLFVRNADNPSCSSEPFPFVVNGKAILFIGKKNDLADGLGEDKETEFLSAMIADGYAVHYEKDSVFKDNYATIADMYADGHQCIKAIVVGPDSKEIKDSTLITWDIPIVLLGGKDVYKDFGGGIGSSQGESDSSPKNNITVTNNSDPGGLLNGFAPGQVEVSTEDKKMQWVEPTGSMTVLANLDGDPDEALVWYVNRGGDYGSGTTANLLIGLGFEKDHGKELSADGATIVNQAVAVAYANRSAC